MNTSKLTIIARLQSDMPSWMRCMTWENISPQMNWVQHLKRIIFEFLVPHFTTTMRLFIELRLVVRHRFIGQTKYEACYNNEDHIHQICTLCGTVTEVDSPEIADAIKNTKFHRFRRDGFSLYIYGICSRCQAALSRQRSKFLHRNK